VHVLVYITSIHANPSLLPTFRPSLQVNTDFCPAFKHCCQHVSNTRTLIELHIISVHMTPLRLYYFILFSILVL